MLEKRAGAFRSGGEFLLLSHPNIRVPEVPKFWEKRAIYIGIGTC
jgi:hypothetical protein